MTRAGVRTARIALLVARLEGADFDISQPQQLPPKTKLMMIMMMIMMVMSTTTPQTTAARGFLPPFWRGAASSHS
jgi:hypothetical protein